MNHFITFTTAAALAAKHPKPGDWSFGWLGVASIAEVALAVIICLWTIRNYLAAHRQRLNNSPWHLFIDLCTVHKLSRRERYLLRRLMKEHRLEQPAALFVEPSWYTAEKLGASWGGCFDELDKLKQRLFADH